MLAFPVGQQDYYYHQLIKNQPNTAKIFLKFPEFFDKLL